jgi:hypothetical protein
MPGVPSSRVGPLGHRACASRRASQQSRHSDRTLGVILVRLRIAEIDEDTIAHVWLQSPRTDQQSQRCTSLIDGNDLAWVLWVHTRRECGRTDEIGEHYRDLAALGTVPWRGGRCILNGGVQRIVSSVIARSAGGPVRTLRVLSDLGLCRLKRSMQHKH